MREQILALAMALGGVESGPALEELCLAARRELADRLKDGVSEEDCGPAFAVAAAWLALAGLYAGQGEAESFTAGELTVRTGNDGQARAQALRAQAEQLMSPYLKDRGFAFLGVRG